MKNIVYYSDLSITIKKAITDFFKERKPDIISFPFNGKHMKGFFFLWENINYLIIKAEVIRNGNAVLELDLIKDNKS